MRAAVLREPGGDLVIEEIPIPEPGPGEVLVKVHGCGVCHTDLHVMDGGVGFPTPAVLGHEMSGGIARAHESVSGFDVGDAVVTSFIMPCGNCRFCFAGRSDLCETFFEMNRLNGTLYDGLSRLKTLDGLPLAMYSMAGHAEYAVVPVTGVYHRPDALDAADAAILGCAFFTAFGAVKHRAAVTAGERVVVLGVGGVGMAIIQLARAFGATDVVAVDLDDEKLELARRNGATDVVNAISGDVVDGVRAITGDGMDVAFEAIGLPATWVQGTEMLADGGRLVAVGIGGHGATAPVEITRIVRRSISIIGSYGARAPTDMPEIMRLVERGKIDPSSIVTRYYELGEADKAYKSLEAGEIVGRAVLVPKSSN